MTEKIDFKHCIPIQVRFTDIDMMSHVTNSKHLAYCDIARMEYFNDVLSEQMEQREESLVIASITIDFVRPIFLYEKVEVRTATTKIGNKSIQMLQHVVNAETGELKSVVKSIMSGFNYVAQESIVVPERWKKRLAEYDINVEYKYK